MARFDVCHVSGIRGARYALVIQSDFYDHLPTRLAIPLYPLDRMEAVTRINPVFEIEGEKYTARTDLLVSVTASRLGKVVTSLAEHDIEITGALDRLISGF